MHEDEALRAIASTLGRIAMYLRHLTQRELQKPVLPRDEAVQVKHREGLEGTAVQPRKGH